MAVYIALLRGINVGGNRKVPMADLRTFAGDLGFGNVRTLLQSGNLVFEGEEKPADEIEKLLETEAAKRLGLTTDFLVRNAQEWAAIVAGNPFPEMAQSDPGHLVVVFLKDAPATERVVALLSAIVGPEEVHVEGRHAYITYPANIGDSKLTNVVIEKKLGTRGTGRNWNTINKLLACL